MLKIEGKYAPQWLRVSPVTKIQLYFDFDVHPYYSHMSKFSRSQVMHTLTTTYSHPPLNDTPPTFDTHLYTL